MKKIILIWSLLSGMVFYTLNSNSAYLKDKFIGHLQEKPNFSANLSRNGDGENGVPPKEKFVCVKIDNCYYCLSTNKRI